jgi:putative acetyltransferase
MDSSEAGPMNVALESPDQPDVIALIAALDAYQDTLYPPESRHALDLVSLQQANVVFVVARDAAGQAVGCGAVVLHAAHGGELKRMYVAPHARGQGTAQTLLALLETKARAAGCRLLRLETGPYQPEALALYERCGYQRCAVFAPYRDDPLSVFMEKTLVP